MSEREADVFDYVIVGAGTAGCVLASRLSEDPSVRVALIEAGPLDTHPFIHIPAMVGAAIAQPHLNWRFMTAPQAHLNGRPIPIPRGHVVGGSGSINGMVYFRGHPTDFDDWAVGNPGWSYREVMPYFLRSENNEAYRGSPYHGQGGPMNVIFIKRPNPMTPAFLAAMDSLGYHRNEDFNGPESEGYGPRQGTIAKGRRVSTATAYLKPASRRSNLTLLTDTRATRLGIENGRATGVDLITAAGGSRRIGARKEVIVCGGAVLSPQLLMLSGIGDETALRAAGVEVKHHLPGVGANYHDHLAVGVLMEMTNSESYGISWRAAPRGLANILEYALFRTGPLSSNVFEATGFIRSRPGLARPDVQVVFQAARRNTNTFPFPLGHGFAINVLNLYPKSRGHVRLASSDPRAAPIVDPQLFSHPDDVATLLRALKIGRRVSQAPSFSRYRAVEVQPGPGVQDDAALVEYIRRAASTVHHPCGSCRMGPDANSVVDAQLRVHGIEALRVADASVFPSVVGGNTNAAVVMIAEKAADLIRGIAAPQPIDLPLARSA
jgi:choline dehydrogenase